MHVNEQVLAPLRARYGEPRRLAAEHELAAMEHELVLASTRKGRHHDITFFVLNGARLALIRKPHYGPGLWRPPGGGLKRGEIFEEGLRREALEELGVEVELRRYLVCVSAVFSHGEERIPWQTHVFEARTEAKELAPLDRREISAARWGTLEELGGPIRARLLATGRSLWRYRVELHDAAIEELQRFDSFQTRA
jgi:ADP-ribose pyrophosphatase YjhB (NUDIX family)